MSQNRGFSCNCLFGLGVPELVVIAGVAALIFCPKKYDVAKNLYEEMLKRKLRPEASCYFTLVSFLCKGKDFESALSICKKSLEKGWVPNFESMKTLVDGLVSIEKVDEARELVGIVKERFTRNADRWSEIEEGLPK